VKSECGTTRNLRGSTDYAAYTMMAADSSVLAVEYKIILSRRLKETC
jgi:hypothetical protein